MITLSAAIKVAYECAQLYRANLQNKNYLFIYQDGQSFEYIETLFSARHFMHLTGLRSRSLSAQGFYHSCLKKRLGANDIYCSGSGTTELKLHVLPHLLNMPLKSMMIGRSANDGFLLYTDTLVGTIRGSMGFIPDQSSFYVPNTTLKEDIRKLVKKPFQIKMACSKARKDTLYSTIFCRNNFALSILPEAIQKIISH